LCNVESASHCYVEKQSYVEKHHRDGAEEIKVVPC